MIEGSEGTILSLEPISEPLNRNLDGHLAPHARVPVTVYFINTACARGAARIEFNCRSGTQLSGGFRQIAYAMSSDSRGKQIEIARLAAARETQGGVRPGVRAQTPQRAPVLVRNCQERRG